MKKLVYAITAAVCVLFSVNVFAESQWSKEYTEQIQRGIQYKYILKYSNGTFSRLHVLECDLDDPSVSVGVMTASNGSSYLENTKKMTENSGAIVAVNGDFFNLKQAPTNMLGVVFQDGELVSTPSKDLWATFAVTDTGKILMDYFGFEGTVISPQGYTAELYQVNKEPTGGGAINMFTKKWGSSVYCSDSMQAVLVKDGRVTEKITGGGNISFGDNDKIFLTNYSVNSFFDNFNVGDEIKYEYSITGCEENIAEATGANTLIVADGKRAAFTNDITGYAQRTAAGVTADGKKLILAVCDGRQTDCKGMTQAMMADAMIELGCVRAVNLDGGGSSTMTVRDEITDVVSVKNSVSSLRNVSTSVGIFNKSEYIGNVSGATLRLSDSVVLKGDYLEPYYRFYDDNNHTIYPEEASEVTFSSTDASALYENGHIYFNTGGAQKVYATFDGITAECDVYVIDDVASCYIYPENVTVSDGASVSISLTVRDKYGKKAYVHPEQVNWVGSGVTVSGGVISGGIGYVGVEFENASAYCSVNGAKHPENRLQATAFMTGKPDGAKVIRISAGCEKYSTIANMIRALNYEYSLDGADGLYMLNPPLIKDLQYTSVNSYSQTPIENTLIVTLDSSSSKINKQGQLDNIARLADSYEKNIVIITKNSPDEYSDNEKRLFFDSLERAKNNEKNVFVVYEAQNTQSFVGDGIYYITCSPTSGAGDGSVVELYLQDATISYALIK